MTSTTGPAVATDPLVGRASTSDHPTPRSAAGRYLTFTLHDEVYALDIMRVTEIIGFRPLTVVPMMPSAIRGVINLRGRVLPVLDLAARFGQGVTQVARRTAILVVEGRLPTPVADGEGPGADVALGVGILVDAVSKVVQLGDDDIAGPPSFGAGPRTGFISGMARLDGDFAVVLDIDRVLAMQDPTPAVTGAPEPGHEL
ncbi:chemotaxis protein CheW [Lapillicoccus jejuensis]|uniref:Purine-binding chemotaxis protein CheW n=1 Tax=Lapillicoccus jejuensis TaxID=402171 RepID=A0A542E4G8_9MICO|nr:chemotaxis protein CheW [Lapillicoccus jejuensis]TQJ10248.1 purine-binding chemotaxis protein CheW [Lapillicoccus jejuensis]